MVINVLFTLCMRRSRGEMYTGHGYLYVCRLSHSHTIAWTGRNSGGMVGGALYTQTTTVLRPFACHTCAACPQRFSSRTTTTTTTVLRPFFRDHPGEPVLEENFWTLWCKGRLTGRHTDHPAWHHSIWTNQCPAPPSPYFFYGPDALPATQPTVSKH